MWRRHVGVHQHGGRKRLPTSRVYFGYLKRFLLLVNLQTFTCTFILSFWLFRPQKHRENHYFYVRDTFLRSNLMSRTVKSSEIQTVLFSKQNTLPSWKQVSRYISTMIWRLREEHKNSKKLYTFVIFYDIICPPRTVQFPVFKLNPYPNLRVTTWEF